MTTDETPSETVARITRHALIDHADELMHIDDPDVLANAVSQGGTDFMLGFWKYQKSPLNELITESLTGIETTAATVAEIDETTSSETLLEIASDVKNSFKSLDDIAVILNIAASLGDVENTDTTRTAAAKIREIYEEYRFLDHDQMLKEHVDEYYDTPPVDEETARQNLREEIEDRFATGGIADEVTTELTKIELIEE